MNKTLMLLGCAACACCAGAAEEKVFGTARAVPGGEGRAMALALEGKTLYAGVDGRVVVFDVSQPLAPRKTGEVDGLGGVRQLVAQKGFVYATARESGFWIVDATDPARPRIRARFDSCELATGVDVAGPVAFVGQRQNGVEFIDVSDPDHPAHIAMRKTDESQSVIYRDGFLYSGDWGSGRLTVFDARDMRAIRQVACEPLWGYGDGVWKKGNFLYACTGHHAKNRDLSTLPFKPVDTPEIRTYGKFNAGSGCGHGLDVFDVSDPARPRRTGRADFPPFYARGLDMWTPRTSANSDIVFCAQTHNGIFAVDCADKAHPRVLDRWVFPVPKRADWPSTCLGSVAVGDGCVYVAGQDCGVQVIPARGAAAETTVKGTPPLNPSFREPYPTETRDFHVWKSAKPGQARAVALRGDTVYAACGDAGLHVLKILPQGGFAHVGELPDAPAVFDVQVESNRLYTAEGLAGWAAYEITGPASFREVARRACSAKRKDPALIVWKPVPGRIFLSTRRNGANLFAMENWTEPERRPLAQAGGCPGWDKYLMDAVVGHGRWIAYNSANTCINWFDLAENRVVKSSAKNRTNLSCGLCRLSDDRVLMTKEGGYSLLEPGVPDPADGGTWPRLDFPGRKMNGMPRASKGGRLVLTNRILREIGLWDFSDVSNPRFLRHWKVSGNPDLAVFHGEKFIVPCGHQGVIMEK